MTIHYRNSQDTWTLHAAKGYVIYWSSEFFKKQPSEEFKQRNKKGCSRDTSLFQNKDIRWRMYSITAEVQYFDNTLFVVNAELFTYYFADHNRTYVLLVCIYSSAPILPALQKLLYVNWYCGLLHTSQVFAFSAKPSFWNKNIICNSKLESWFTTFANGAFCKTWIKRNAATCIILTTQLWVEQR